MKTAEELLKEERIYFDSIETSHIIDAMKEYAEQEVKKHLEIAANLCKIKSDAMAITGIQIELT